MLAEEQVRSSSLMAEKQELEEQLTAFSKASGTVHVHMHAHAHIDTSSHSCFVFSFRLPWYLFIFF